MKLKKQYEVLTELKDEINVRLKDLDFRKISELLLWLAASEEYYKLYKKDNQLLALEFFRETWLEERKNPNDFVMQGDSFFGVNCLDDLEMKYAKILFAVFRVENDMPYEYCVSAIQVLIEYQVSPLALYRIIVRETDKKEENIVKTAVLLKEQNQLVKAIGLLQKGVDNYPENDEMKLELADAWLMAKQWQKAYEILLQIKQPNDEIKEMMKEMEKVIGHEGV